MRYLAFAVVAALAVVFSALVLVSALWAWAAGPMLALAAVGVYDLVQTEHTLRRNYPLVGRVRWGAEALRPFIQQYFIEGVTDGLPFDRESRDLVYRRAKGVVSVEPFGSHLDFDEPDYEWINPSIAAKEPAADGFRVRVGEARCASPYSASVYNISAMSFGSLGARAIEALNRGAAMGGFYHDTGEGGACRHHFAGGGDLVWELGSGYFGARAPDGGFDLERFKDVAARDAVKMIELKLSQGAKPGHGGMLPAAKITAEIAEARGVPMGVDCISPPHHRAFSTPKGLLEFLARLREASGGKPVGFKLCIGHRWEFLAIVKAMLETGLRPDYVVVDGAEGGTGAAPVEFQDHVGAPLRQGLVFVRNALVGAGLKDEIRIAASGKIVTGFQMAVAMALGADWCNAGRPFMFALGCVMTLKCHTNRCPTGIATQDRLRQRGLDIHDKAERVASFHRRTVAALGAVVAAAGLDHPEDLRPQHLHHRVSSTEARRMDQIYRLLKDRELIDSPSDTHLAEDWARARADSFEANG